MRIANIFALAVTCFLAGNGLQTQDVLRSSTVVDNIQFRVNCEDMQTIRASDKEFFERIDELGVSTREALDIAETFLREKQNMEEIHCSSVQVVLEGNPFYALEFFTRHTNKRKVVKHRRWKIQVGIHGKLVRTCFLSYRLPGTVVKSDMLEMPNGMIYNDVIVGDGAEVQRDSTVRIDYALSLLNGSLITNTHNENMSRVFKLTEAPFEGLAAGLLGMRANGKRKLVVPPSLAYGRLGFGESIPPDATLVLDVVLRTVR